MHKSLLIVLALGLLPATGMAHGGQYKGPSDAGGSSGGSGGNSAPPTNPGGAAAPGPGAPASGGSVTSGATGGGKTRGESQRGATTGAGTLEIATSYETWEFWWENNKDQYLNLKSRVVKVTNQSGSSGALTGRGRQSDARSTKRPSLELINGEVLPALTALVTSSDKRDIIDSGILAMSRAAQADSADLVINTATPLLDHQELSVQTAAALSLGIMGSPKALPTVTALMTNSAEGRKLVGGGDVPQLVRAFGALSEGLIDDPSSVKNLIDIVENTKDSERDIKVAALVALGLVNSTAKNDAYQYLVKKLGDEKLDSIIASYVPTSLGKLGNAEAVPELLKVFVSKDTDVFVRQSAAIGLGQLASLNQAEVVKALKEYIAEGKDQQTRHFCFISLAQIGRRAATAGLDGVDAGHAELVKLFGDEIRKPSNAAHRSWAGLAAAIYTQKFTEGQPVLVERLRDAWEKENDLSYKSAFGIALGLLHIDDMGKKLFDEFQSTKDPDHKGYTAVALGFLTYTDSADVLRQQSQIKSLTPTYRLQVATGLGLMGDAQAVSTLVATLQTAETLGVSSAVAKALGLIGDTEAVAPLLDIAQDAKKQDIVRAFACVALGIVCEKTDLPWNARISANNNYRARVPAIDEVLDIL
jgi:HEAT repeat protein